METTVCAKCGNTGIIGNGPTSFNPKACDCGLTNHAKDGQVVRVVMPVPSEQEKQEAMWGEVISECRIYNGTPTYFLMIQKRLSERFSITRK